MRSFPSVCVYVAGVCKFKSRCRDLNDSCEAVTSFLHLNLSLLQYTNHSHTHCTYKLYIYLHIQDRVDLLSCECCEGVGWTREEGGSGHVSYASPFSPLHSSNLFSGQYQYFSLKGYTRFTTLFFKPLSDQWCGRYSCFSSLWLNSNNFIKFFLQQKPKSKIIHFQRNKHVYILIRQSLVNGTCFIKLRVT